MLKQYIIYLIALTFFCSASFADTDAGRIVDKFMRDSIQPRMAYLYRNRFCNVSDKKNLYRLAKEASDELEVVVSACRLEKDRIEEYSADDWDVKFGVTGRWRQAAFDLNNAVRLKSKIDYYVDLSSGVSKKRGEEKGEKSSVPVDANNFEGNVALAFERLRAGDDSKLNAVIKCWPKTEYFFEKTVLNCLESSGDIKNLTLSEARLAGAGALASGPGRYRDILTTLAETKRFAEPTILYAAAIGCVDSEPNRAIEFFVKASRMDSPIALDCAAEAAKLAYQLYNNSGIDCSFAVSVFENYVNIAGVKIDETLQYCYSRLLNECSEVQQATELLKKIAGRDNGQFAHRAEFELIVNGSEKNKAHALRQLIEKISADKPIDRQLRYEVIAAYCREQLSPAKLNNALEVIDVLKAMGHRDCRLSEYVLLSLAKITGRIDEYEDQLSKSVMQSCYDIAFDYYNCFEGQQKVSAGIFCAELGTFVRNRANVERFLDDLAKIADGNDINVLRCKARLLMTEGKYEQAGLLWARIADFRKSPTEADSLSNWQWWRGRYYELYCASKVGRVDAAVIKHNADVLLHSSTDIVAFWKEKLMKIYTEKL